ncbi:YciI family protein [Candidatus Leptofilum sp.]|uniref:YciI family protein n=1 Tax=Candidatus Leptofilum sp. TaxID=3241576 RepID=UPI003B5CE836
MTQFVLLYTGGSMPESEEESAKVMQEWGAWMGSLGEALVSGGNPFTPQVKNIDNSGNVADGPAGTQATGYSIIEADSLDTAVELAKGCPHWRHGGDISVYETIRM